MSENDIRAWRESAAKPQELPTDRLIHRLVKRAYSHGWLAHKSGANSESAERHKELVKNDRDELLERRRREEELKKQLDRFAFALDEEMGRVSEREKEISRLHDKFGVEPEIWTSILNCVRKVSDGSEGDDVHPLARVYVFGARHMAEELRDG